MAKNAIADIDLNDVAEVIRLIVKIVEDLRK